MPTVTPLDLALVLGLLLSIWYGTRRGLMYELLALFGWILAFAAARMLGIGTGQILLVQLLRMDWMPPVLRDAIGCGLVFVLALFAWGALSGVLRRPWSKLTDIRKLDRSLGGLFGIARAFVMGWAALLIFARLPSVEKAPWFESSLLTPWLARALDALLVHVPQLATLLPI